MLRASKSSFLSSMNYICNDRRMSVLLNFAVIFFVIGSVSLSGASLSSDKSHSLMLIVENNSTKNSITCDLYLAHWFLYEIGTVKAGHFRELQMTLHASDRLLTIKNDKNVDMAISGIHCRSHGAGGKTLEHWTPADKFRTDAGKWN